MRAILCFFLLVSCGFAQTVPPLPPAPAKAPAFPALTVQVTVGTKQRANSNSSYMKTMTIEPKVIIDGVSRMAPIPALEAIMLIVTMDTRAKYTAGSEIYNIHASQTIAIPAAKDGSRRQFPFLESSVTFDSYRDSSNAGGEVYKYYIFGLKDPATSEIVDFRTNNPALTKFCKENPAKRAEFLALLKGGKLPANFK